MGFARKHGFKIAVLTLCAAMGLYLYLSNSKAASPKLDKLITAPNFQSTDLDGKQVTLDDSKGKVRVIYFFCELPGYLSANDLFNDPSTESAEG